MNIQIVGDNFNLSDSTRALIEEKVAEHLDKLLSHIPSDNKIASLRIQKDKLENFNVNFDMNLPGKKQIFAQTSHRILKSALIDLSQEVERQIEKYKAEISL